MMSLMALRCLALPEGRVAPPPDPLSRPGLRDAVHLDLGGEGSGGLCQAQGRRFDLGHPLSLAALHAAIMPPSSCGIASGDTSPVEALAVRRAPHDVLRVPVAVAGRRGVEAAVNHEL